MPIFIQPSFARGELSPDLYGRVDTAIYNIGLRTARNMIVETQGGISNRAGTVYMGPAKLHDADPRIIPFKFNTIDKYFLEFGNLYMRVIRNGSYVVEPDVAITGATAANPIVITAPGHGYTNGDEISISGAAGMVEVNGRRFNIANTTASTFELLNQVTNAAVDGSAFTAYTSGGAASKVYEIVTPYAVADTIQIKYQQTADVMTLTHSLYAPQELTRSGHTSWTIAIPEFVPDTNFTAGVSVVVNSAGTTTYRYQVTVIRENPFEESLPGTAIVKTVTGITNANPAVVTAPSHGFSDGDEVAIAGAVGLASLNGRRFKISGVTASTFAVDGGDTLADGQYLSGGTASTTFAITTLGHATVVDNTISWAPVAGADRYTVYKEENGLFSFLGETERTFFEDKNIAPDVSVTPPKFRNPFFGDGNFPAAVGYYEQRRVFGGSIVGPDTIHYSKTGNLSNYTFASPRQADDAITSTLASGQVNEIRHFVPGTDLLIMTSGSEWRSNSGSNVGFAADTLRQKPQSFWGCSHHRPEVAGAVILFVAENNSQLRTLGFSLQQDRYIGVDLGLASSHLLEGRTIVDTAFANSPSPRMYLVLDNGELITVTYNPEQDMIAWTRWDTLGKFTRIAVLRNEASDSEDSIALVVKRTINGNTVRFVERVNSRIFDTPQDSYFMDAGLSLDAPVTITGITAANPVVVTATAHGFINGDEVDLHDIEFTPQFDSAFNETQPDQLNGRRYTVANKTANTFELSGIDGTANVVYVGGGKARKAISQIRGLFHLVGESVVVLADGNVVTGHSIDSTGKLSPDLARKASRVHIGKRYISDVETLDLESGASSKFGVVQGLKKSVAGVVIRVKKTRGLLVGQNSGSLRQVKFRENEAMSNPTDLHTGDKSITLDPSWKSNGRVFIRQPFPLPMTLLAVIPKVDIGGK